ncbi:MAG TPA: DUF5011 domain-containing protein [Chitinophagaceae bacterium]|jgi:hypothetical protein|nr:DUF5011 domain-containing protein [Chitinophagaceae bacterium]
MKKIIQLLFLSVIIGLVACNKDEIHNTDEQVGISRVTHFPVFQVSGDEFMSVVKGSTFTDPGVKAFEGGTEIPVKVSGSVNTNQTGLYVITYSATNKDNFSATTTRTVVVIAAHENAGVDLSGKYDYVGSSTYTATVTKVAEGTYTTDNSWSGLTIIPIVFVSLDGLAISIPSQATAFGTAFGTGTYTPATKRLVYTISIPSQGISNSNRTWQRQ